MQYIEALSIDDHILDKIESKHRIFWADIEEVCFSESHHVRRGREGLYKMFGKTLAGRHILVVLVDEGWGQWKVVNARDMTSTEKRLYKRTSGGS